MRNLVVAIAFAALGAAPACNGARGPSDEAIARYVDGKAPGGAIAPTARPPAADGAAAAAAPRVAAATRIAIEVVSGSGLHDMDDGPGETDAFVELEYEGWRDRTSVADGTLEPTWGDRFVIDVREGGVLRVTLMDRDALTSDEKMGVQSFPIAPIAPGEARELAVTFRGGDFGEIKLRVTGLP